MSSPSQPQAPLPGARSDATASAARRVSRTGRRWRQALPALLAVTLLAWAAQAAAPPGSAPCAPWAGPFANIDASIDAGGDGTVRDADGEADGKADGEGATLHAPWPGINDSDDSDEADDGDDLDADPLDALPLPVEPGTPPQVVAMQIDQARQRGHALVLLLPAPVAWHAAVRCQPAAPLRAAAWAV